MAATEPFSEQAATTCRINYFGTLNVCHSLFPLLRPHARVVNMSSSAGWLKRIPAIELRRKLADENLTETQLEELVNDFIRSALPKSPLTHFPKFQLYITTSTLCFTIQSCL